MTRREFIRLGTTAVAAFGIGSMAGKWFEVGDGVVAMAASDGYLVVDTKKCAACKSCMLACSLVHHGRENLTLSRIQIIDNPFGTFPNDVSMNQCRQCPAAPCVEVCPTGANFIDKKNGNVRMVEPKKCIGCQQCVEACPHTPSRIIWNAEDRHAQKCDLCVHTPYWEEKGGPGGKQACVSVCPMKAIKFTDKIPVQSESGYNVNLRNDNYGWLGLPTD